MTRCRRIGVGGPDSKCLGEAAADRNEQNSTAPLTMIRRTAQAQVWPSSKPPQRR